uniref:Lipase n=1 Tax=Panagrolaimus sp. JU765 TaxID=591449 RepID=A0AC34R737_9BILA
MPKIVLFFAIFLIVFGKCVGKLPEQDMNVPELVAYYGYPIETITTETPDGYFLVLHRIPFGKNATMTDERRPVIFLQHGLFGSSADWSTNVPAQSAAYVFADAGFDVWMGNVRGNVYSEKHRSFSRFSTKFWNFTFDDHAAIDLPVMVQTILNITKEDSLYYVGHSQGTAIMFAQGSENQPFAEKISAFFALAPVTTVAHIRGTAIMFAQGSENQPFAEKISAFFALAPVTTVAHIRGLMAFIGARFGSKMGKIIEIFGAYDFLPSGFFEKLFAYVICGEKWFKNPLCSNLLFQIAGPDSKDINMTRVMIYMDHTPAGSSTKNVVHWAQMVASGKFCKYDYGTKNQEFYGQPTAPEYNISKLRIPTYLYYSADDWLADPLDVEGNIIPKLNKTVLKESNHLGVYNHL